MVGAFLETLINPTTEKNGSLKVLERFFPENHFQLVSDDVHVDHTGHRGDVATEAESGRLYAGRQGTRMLSL